MEQKRKFFDKTVGFDLKERGLFLLMLDATFQFGKTILLMGTMLL